jgi:hypothetical protein
MVASVVKGASSSSVSGGSGVRRETVIAPLGYMTTPNQYGVFPEGALAQAENVVMRAKGKLLTAPGVTSGVALGSNGMFVIKPMPLDAGHVYSFNVNNHTWEAFETNGTTSGVASVPSNISVTDLYPYQRTSPVRVRNRMLVNSYQGVLASDSMAPANSTDRALRCAGFPQTTIISTTIASGTGFPIPPGIMVSYRSCVTRESADGYIIKSVPSPAIRFFNNHATSSYKITLAFSFSGTLGAALKAGDFLEVYRTDGLVTTTVNTDPGTTFKLINRYTLTAADIAAHFVSFNDETVLAGPFYSTTGRELYTNPYQEGETAGNRQPDINGAQAVFKGYTFYGSLTERPQATLSCPGGIWDRFGTDSALYPNARAKGIGGRIGAGTVTAGSATITGVSAADMVGLAVGQQIAGTGQFSVGTVISALGATTITLNIVAAANSTFFFANDVIECSALNTSSGSVAFSSAPELVQGFANANASIEVTTNMTPAFSVLTPTTDVQANIGFAMEIEPSRPSVASFTLRATNGQNYSPPLPLITATAQTFSQTTTANLMRWSKDSEPEHVPSVNETRVGGGTIIQLVSTKDALWIFCTDGIFRLSGDAGVWRIDVIAPGCVLCGPSFATSMRDVPYAYTNYGFVRVTDAGIDPISDLQIKADLPGPAFIDSSTFLVPGTGCIVSNDDDEEVLIFTTFTSQKFFIYNARQNAFTYIQNAASQNMFNMTAAASQANPATGSQAVLIARAPQGGGVPPLYGAWNNVFYCPPNVQYRALYAKNPMSTKQWIDMSMIFAAANSGVTIVGTVGGSAVGQSDLKSGANDSYVTIGIPRQSAISPSITPGFQSTTLTQLQFEGVSLRLVELGIQQVRR